MKALPFTLTILTLPVDLSMINDTTINLEWDTRILRIMIGNPGN